MSQAKVYVRNLWAGILTEDEEGYTFRYNDQYLANEETEPISLTLPLTATPYRSTVLFPFFDGLIPEGWLLDIAEQNWKINRRDRFAMLLACCKNCIGAVSIVPVENS